MPELKRTDDNPFHVTLTRVEHDPYAAPLYFGLAGEGQMQGVTGHAGDRADWAKFEREARPSENIEDARKPVDTSILGRLLRGSESVNNAAETALQNLAYYGQNSPIAQSDPFTAAEPPAGFHDPLRIGKVLAGFAQGVMTPGMAAQGVTPETPGMVSDVDVARQLMQDDQAHIWAARAAMQRR
jgi:hypothetical protein